MPGSISCHSSFTPTYSRKIAKNLTWTREESLILRLVTLLQLCELAFLAPLSDDGSDDSNRQRYRDHAERNDNRNFYVNAYNVKRTDEHLDADKPEHE